nr:hypothetical protein [Tanacetum cinerariifolium]
QLPLRSDEDINLKMAKLVKSNRILLNDNIFPHEEASMEVLLAKERILKLIQAWDDKQLESWILPALLLQLLNDSRTINEMLKQREQVANLAYKEYLEKSPDIITTVLPIEEPEYSLSMGYEHLSTILETEYDEVIESSAKNLLPILSEYEVTSDDESECDVPVKDESSLFFMTFSNPLFDDNDDFTSSDDESLPDEDVSIEEFKVYSNPLFDDEEINSDNIANEEHIRREHAEYISLMKMLFTINPFPRPLENFQSHTIIETLPTSPIPLEDSDSQREEIDIFTVTDLLPPSIESDDYDSEGDIHVLQELLVDDSIYLSENKSFYFDHQDDSSFPRPPPEPPDVEIFFEPNSGVLTTNVVKGISEYVLMPNILPTLPTFDPLYPVYDTLLSFSSENEDKVFKPGILSYLFVSHRDKTISDFSKNPMMMYGGDIPLFDDQYLHFYPP